MPATPLTSEVSRTRPPSAPSRLVLLALALLIGPGLLPAEAQGSAPAERSVSSDPSAEAVPAAPLSPATLDEVEGPVLPLTLDQAVELALARNLLLEIQRYDLAQSLNLVQQAKGDFDLNLSGRLSFEDETTPSGSQLDGADVLDEETQLFTFQAQQLNPWGGVATLTWFNQRLESNNSFLDLNPRYDAGADVTYTQPLLRGLGPASARRGVLLAKKDSQVSALTFELQLTDTIENVERAYWNLVAAREQLAVSEQGMATAGQLLERNQKRVDAGTLAPFELVQSEAGLARRRGDVIRDQANLGDAEDALRRLLNLEEGLLWETPIQPRTQAEVEALEVDLGEALETAYQARPEMRSQRAVVERLEIDARFFRNQRRPGLDLQVGYGADGLDGRQMVGTPPVLVDRGLSEAVEQILDLDFTGWNAALIFSFPLQNRMAKASAANADLAVDQARLELEDLRQQVATEVRSAVRQLDSAARQVEAARAARDAQEKSLEAERKRFDNGLSTSFQVLQIQEDLTEAQSAEVRAITFYRNQLAQLYRATGQLIEQSGVRIVGEASP